MRRKKKGLNFYQKKKKVNKKFFREIAALAICAVIASFVAFVLVFVFGIRTSVIGNSMEPSLYNGQEILINRFVYTISKPHRGDVVVFLPNGNKNSHYYVKRVVGVPGDTVQIKGGQLYVNGKIYSKHISDKIADAGIASNEIELGKDEYFVLGDNVNNSEDSRSANVGVVKEKDIIGKAWFHLKSEHGSMGRIR